MLASSKLKSFAYKNFEVAQMMELISNRRENIVGKGEIAGYQHFSFSYNVSKSFHSEGLFGKELSSVFQGRYNQSVQGTVVAFVKGANSGITILKTNNNDI